MKVQQASEIDQRRTRIARLQAEIRQMAEDYAKRPKVITLTASTRKAVEAGYLAQWVHKIEHTGNFDPPAGCPNQATEWSPAYECAPEFAGQGAGRQYHQVIGNDYT